MSGPPSKPEVPREKEGATEEDASIEELESMATRLPLDRREAFWREPGRGDARRLLRRAAPGPVAQEVGDPSDRLGEQTVRLLELIKRLARERDVDRLLERITDAAVELTGAERGLLLLVGEDGTLLPETVSGGGDDKQDPRVAFSQSIAEAVLIDGEPIVTVDARNDVRLAEYLSVHRLMLRSVACLPIHGKTGVLGVLYLEHRLRRGRFGEDDLDWLYAFADQAAIALENAQLIAENERRRTALEAVNRQLADAKQQTERVLAARTAELEDIKREMGRARPSLGAGYEKHGIVGTSESMRRVFAVIDRLRDTAVPVVIQGESGTGKELVARAIHYGGSRAESPFVAINCGAFPEALLEAELFGNVRGAFTGADRDRPGVIARARSGTLFLDEVGDMPAKMQVDLLRVLQDGRVRPVGGDRDEEVDVRIVAASNRSLADLVARGQFREDLYYRLNVVELSLPALRDRREDIPLLVEHFLSRFAEQHGSPRKQLARSALHDMMHYPWPGNIRQLEHVLLRACVLEPGNLLAAVNLAAEEATDSDRSSEAGGRAAADVPQSNQDYKTQEKQRILQALERSAWNRARAAKALGIPRRTFYRRLKEYEILT